MKDSYIVRCTDDMRLRKNFAGTKYFKFSYFNRIVDCWNSLPSSIHNSSHLNTFKNNLMKYLVLIIFEFDAKKC